MLIKLSLLSTWQRVRRHTLLCGYWRRGSQGRPLGRSSPGEISPEAVLNWNVVWDLAIHWAVGQNKLILLPLTRLVAPPSHWQDILTGQEGVESDRKDSKNLLIADSIIHITRENVCFSPSIGLNNVWSQDGIKVVARGCGATTK